jgi:hypothetical protein
MLPESYVKLLSSVEAEWAARSTLDYGDYEQGEVFQRTEYSSWTCVCMKPHVSCSWNPDMIQCNRKCTSRENRTDVKIVSPKCHSCGRTRCAQCKTYFAMRIPYDAIYEADVLGTPAVQRPSRPPNQSPRPRESNTHWYCVSEYSFADLLNANSKQCRCGNGPVLLENNPRCTSCFHFACSRCTYQKR